MKNFKNKLLIFILILSVLCNALLYYYLLQERKPVPAITRFSFSEHGIFIHCERSSDVQTVKLDADNKAFIIGDARLESRDDALYLINPEQEINLSAYEGSGFVINSDGELLYSINTPVEK